MVSGRSEEEELAGREELMGIWLESAAARLGSWELDGEDLALVSDPDTVQATAIRKSVISIA